MPNRNVAITIGIIVGAVAIGIIAIVAKCFMKLESAEVAITYNTYTKTLNDEVFFEGLHMGTPTLSFIKFPSVFQTLSFEDFQCVNLDGVTVSLSVSLQYRVRSSYIRDIVKQFKDGAGHARMLNNVGRSAVRDTCCQFNTTQLQSQRGLFQEDITRRFVDKFDALHTDVTDLQVNNAARPPRYEAAIREKESAREDIEVARNERPQQLMEANTLKRSALSEADIIINKANSDAKIALTQAQAEGQGILNDYQQEAASYKLLKQQNALDNEGFLAYLGVRAIASAKNPVHVAMSGPARTSFVPTVL